MNSAWSLGIFDVTYKPIINITEPKQHGKVIDIKEGNNNFITITVLKVSATVDIHGLVFHFYEAELSK